MRYLHKQLSLCAVVVGSSVVISGGVQAQTITDLFNTGVDAGKVKVLPGNTTTTDLHYTSAANVFVEQSPNGSWAASADSNYIANDGGDGSAVNGGVYSLAYSTTFTLPLNTNLSSVSIAGQWSTDNSGSNILINGTPTGLTSPGFNSFTNFVLPIGSYQTGTNTLTFNWANAGGPGGLNVRFTTMTYSTVATATPEPGVTALLAGLGVSLAGIARRRRRR